MSALDTTIKTVNTCRAPTMADDNGTDLNLLNFHINEGCSLANINVEKVHEGRIKTETDVFGGSWVHQNGDIKELLENENKNLKNSAEQLSNDNLDLDTIIKTVRMCRTSIMADNNVSGLNLLQFHVKEECGTTNTKVEEIDKEIIKTETDVFGGSWVYQNVDINELLANENRYIENSEKQLLSENASVKKEAFEDDSKIWERINNLSTSRQNHNEKEETHEKVGFDEEEKVSERNLIEVVKINNKDEKEKLYFPHGDNDCLSTGLNHTTSKKQKSECNNYNTIGKKKPYKCNECSYATTQKRNLVLHVASYHTMERPYKCNECSYAAARKHNLVLHIASHHTMEKPYKCNECSYATVRKHDLLLHITSRHTMEKPYKCNECSYAAAQKSHLLSHIKYCHTMEKRYKCNECSYASVQRTDLLYHIKSRHTMEKPYKCNDCSYAALRKSSLLVHIQSRHTMEKPYKCNHCSYAALRKNSLLVHIQSRHTMERPYKCNECPFSAVQKSHLLNHIKSRHILK